MRPQIPAIKQNLLELRDAWAMVHDTLSDLRLAWEQEEEFAREQYQGEDEVFRHQRIEGASWRFV